MSCSSLGTPVGATSPPTTISTTSTTVTHATRYSIPLFTQVRRTEILGSSRSPGPMLGGFLMYEIKEDPTIHKKPIIPPASLMAPL